MSTNETSATSSVDEPVQRIDPPMIDPASLWTALSKTPGVGVSITDSEGRLLFVNDTAMVLFSQTTDIDWVGKTIHDFHSPEYCRERIAMIRRVLEQGKPLAITHIYHGRRISSTVWPIRDKSPPFNRALVISRADASNEHIGVPEQIETVSSEYIGLGAFSVLTRRELEVSILLGHGMSVPRIARLLHRSPKTIQRHKAAISQKLGLRGHAELVGVVTAMGLDLDAGKLKRYKED